MSFYKEIPGGWDQPANQPKQEPEDRRGVCGGKRLAHVGLRMLSGAVDWLPPIGIIQVTEGLLKRTETRTVCRDAWNCVQSEVEVYPFEDLSRVLILVWVVGNIVVLQGLTGQSLGKMLVGTKLARGMMIKGEGNWLVVPGIWHSLIRAGVNLVLMFCPVGTVFIFVGVNVTMVAATAKYQSLGDMAAKTIVLAPHQKGKLRRLRGEDARSIL